MIALIRCDDRLIHGQCVVRILKDFSIDRIIVADDFVAQNATLKTIFELAAPSNVNTDILTVADAATLASAYVDGDERVLLLMKSPVTAARLFSECVGLPKELNIGPMGSRKDAKKVTMYCYLTQEEADAAKQLSDAGVRVYFNQVVGQPTVEWADAWK